MFVVCFFFFKQKTAYEMRISDWSSDVCSSDLNPASAYLEWQYRLPVSVPRSDIADIFDFIGPECKLSIEEVDAEPVLEEIAATPAPEFILKAPMPVAEKKPEPEAKPVAIQAVAKQEPKEAAAPAASGTQAAAKAGQTIRVDLEKLDRLVKTDGEPVITQAMLIGRAHV